MALKAGTTLDPYEILSPLGAGGMSDTRIACAAQVGDHNA